MLKVLSNRKYQSGRVGAHISILSRSSN